MSGRLNDLDWKPSSVATTERRTLLREPARAVTVLAALGIVVGSLLPWATGVDSVQHAVGFRPTEGQGDGVWLFAFGIALIILTLSRNAAESRSRTVQLAPILVAICAGLIWITADRSSQDVVDFWIQGGGTGSKTPVVLAVAGSILVAIAGGVWLELRRPAAIRAETGPLVAELGLTRRSVAETVGAGVGAVAGITLGLAVGLYLTGGAIWSVGILIVTGIAGLALGYYLGLRVGRYFFR
jgi:predicted membrane protein